MLPEKQPATPTELILFSDKACEWLGEIRDWSGSHTQTMLLGLRVGTTVIITDMAQVWKMSRILGEPGTVLRHPKFTQGCSRGYAYALEQHTPYRHVGWLEHIHSDAPLKPPSDKRFNSLIFDTEWQIYTTKQYLCPLIIHTSRKHKDALQIRAFEIRYGNEVEIPIQYSKRF